MASRLGFQVNISGDIKRLTDRIDDHQRNNIPFVTAFALTRTAQEIKAAEIEAMTRVFDRPTNYTLNALYVKPATKQHLSAYVLFKDLTGRGGVPAWKFLGPQVEGGGRSHKAHEKRLIETGNMKADEYAIPAKGMPLDASGNISGSVMNRILSDLAIRRDPTQNTTAASRKRNRSKNRGRYFVLRPELIGYSAQSGRNVHPGIYWRVGSKAMVPVILFNRAPRYTARFPFYEIATRVLVSNFARNFSIGWQTYVVRPMRSAA